MDRQREGWWMRDLRIHVPRGSRFLFKFVPLVVSTALLGVLVSVAFGTWQAVAVASPSAVSATVSLALLLYGERRRAEIVTQIGLLVWVAVAASTLAVMLVVGLVRVVNDFLPS